MMKTIGSGGQYLNQISLFTATLGSSIAQGVFPSGDLCHQAQSGVFQGFQVGLW